MSDRSESSSTATQADSTFTRRGVIKTTAAGVGAAATVGGASRFGASPVGSAQAIPPALVVGGGIAAGAGASYLLQNVDNPFVADSNEEYDDSNAEAVRAQIVENSLGMKQSEEAILTTIENLLASSKNYVVADAKKAAIDAFNNGGNTQAAKDAAQPVIDEFYVTQQTNILSHYVAQVSKLNSWFSVAENNDVDLYDLWYGKYMSSYYVEAFNESGTEELSLVDGSSVDYQLFTAKVNSQSNTKYLRIDGPMVKSFSAVTDTSEDTRTTFFEPERYETILEDIVSEHTQISNNMMTLIDDLGVSYATGDIKSGDIISPTDLLGDGSENADYSDAGAQLAAMGLQSSKFAMEIELVETGNTVEGSIYHSDETIDALEKDVEYDPLSDIQGTVYLAYNNADDNKGELIGLEEPFIIRTITDGEGNEYNAANYESKNQQTYDSEIQSIQEELDQIRTVREELEEQRNAAAKDDGGGAGAGFFSGGSNGQTLGLVAAGGALIALLLGRN